MNNEKPLRARFNAGLITILSAISLTQNLFAAGTVTICDEAHLRSALAGGGSVNFAVGGTIDLANTLSITNNTTINASGFSVTLSGSNAVSVLTVTNASTLSLFNLTVANGLAVGTNASSGTSGGVGRGGGVLVLGGTLLASNCQFVANAAIGGVGGTNAAAGGAGCGGGVAVYNGSLRVTNCSFYGNSASGGRGGDPFLTTYGPGGNGIGGAIYAETGTVTVVSCVFQTNQAHGGYPLPFEFGVSSFGGASGGAIAENGGTLSVFHSEFAGNSVQTPVVGSGAKWKGGSPSQGGAIFNLAGSLIITNTGFTSNSAAGGNATYHNTWPGPGQGGAIYNTGPLQIQNSQFNLNSAFGGRSGERGGDGEGGAIFNSGTAQITGSSFSNNLVQGNWGDNWNVIWYPSGESHGGAILNSNSLALSSCTLSDNHSLGLIEPPPGIGQGNPAPGFGGAIYNFGSCFITNSTLTRNVASGGDAITKPNGANAFGGAIYNRNGNVSSLNNTFALNEARGGIAPTNGIGYGGGIYTTGTVTIANTILAHGASGSNGFGVLTDAGYNLSSDASCNFTGLGSLNNTDPVLGPLANYGGPTPTMALLAGSPAINAANPAVFPSTDQRGRARPFGIGPDIGAFESSPPYVIRGKVSGKTLSEEVVINSGVSTTGTMNGSYSLEGLGADTYAVTPQSANYLFLPSQQSITVGPDKLGVNFSAYHWNALSLDEVTGGNLHVVYAGTNGHTFRLQTSPDLKVWSAVSTNTVVSGNYLDMLLPIGTEAAKFHRAVTP